MEALADLCEAIDTGKDPSILTAHAKVLAGVIPSEIARAHVEGRRYAAKKFDAAHGQDQ